MILAVASRSCTFMNILYRMLCYYSMSQKIHLTFYHNFGKCRPIYKILSLSDSRGNFVHTHMKILYLTLNTTLPCET